MGEKDNIIKFDPHKGESELEKERITKTLLISKAYDLISKVALKDKIENNSIFQTLDLKDEFKKIRLSKILNDDKERFLFKMFQDLRIMSPAERAYIVYFNKKPYDANILRKTVDRDGNMELKKFDEKRLEWEDIDFDPILDIRCGLFENKNVLAPKVSEGTDFISNLISFDNMTQLKFGLSEKQFEKAKILGKLYEMNVGILKPLIHEDGVFLVPDDDGWEGMSIRVNDDYVPEMCFSLITKKESFEDNAKYTELNFVYIPLVLNEKTPEEITEIIKKVLDKRKGKIKVVTIPLSKKLVLISQTDTVKDLIEKLKETKGITKEEKEEENLESIIKVLKDISQNNELLI